MTQEQTHVDRIETSADADAHGHMKKVFLRVYVPAQAHFFGSRGGMMVVL